MPWEKSFDVEEAVGLGLNVFWAKGYEATSLSDLLEAIGINKGSFYNAFGSKKKLFVRGLLKYDTEQRKAMMDELSALQNPVTAITMFFDEIIDQSLCDKEHKGCLFVNTALDMPNHDEDIQSIVKKSLAESETFFLEQIALGQKTGTIPDSVDQHQVAKALLASTVGLRVLARGTFDEYGLRAVKEQAISLLKL